MSELFPGELETPTFEERKKFYEEEFGLEKVRWLKFMWDKPVLVADVGTETTRYRPIHKKHLGELVSFDSYESFEDLEEEVIRYVPEDLYYDLRVYKHDQQQTNSIWEKPDGKQLVFHLQPTTTTTDFSTAVDTDGVTSGKDNGIEGCKCEEKREKLAGRRLSQYIFCEECFKKTAEKTKDLYKFLRRNFETVIMFFNGIGFDVHVLDEEAFYMDDYQRDMLFNKLSKRFPIDINGKEHSNDVTWLPGSLNGVTGRKVIRVKLFELTSPLKILYQKSRPEFFNKEKEEGDGFYSTSTL